MVWFPLYPNLMRLVERLTGDFLTAGVPAFALLGERLATRPKARVVYLATSGLAMVGLSTAFARSVYLT